MRAFALVALLAVAGCGWIGGGGAAPEGGGASWCAIDDPGAVEHERVRRKLAAAQVGAVPCAEPKPVRDLPDEIALPLPCGRRMLFRKVSLALPTPLSFEAATFGDPDADEGMQRAITGPWHAQVAGSYSGNGTQSFFYIGKYEVTAPQYAALADATIAPGEEPAPSSDACKASREAVVAVKGDAVLPAVGVAWPDAMAYADRLSRWLIAWEKAHGGVGQVLPANEARPGFVRLPTEIEWEFAARGGNTSDAQGRSYRPASGWVAHADTALADLGWYRDVGQAPPAGSQVFHVGRKAPNRLLIFDTIGNAEELTFDLFRPVRPDQQVGGQTGGAVARGGSAQEDAAGVGVGVRREIDLYDGDGVAAGPVTGFRLAIAAPMFVNSRGTLGREMQGNPQLSARIAAAWTLLQQGSAGGGARGDALTTLDALRATLPPGDAALAGGLDRIRQQLLLSSSEVAVREAQTTEEQFLTAILAAAYAREKSKTLREWERQAATLAPGLTDARGQALLADVQRIIRDEAQERDASYAYYARIVADLGRRDRAAVQRAATAVADRLQRGGMQRFVTWTPLLIGHVAQANGLEPSGAVLGGWVRALEAAQKRGTNGEGMR